MALGGAYSRYDFGRYATFLFVPNVVCKTIGAKVENMRIVRKSDVKSHVRVGDDMSQSKPKRFNIEILKRERLLLWAII